MMASESMCGTMESEGGGYHKTVQRSVGAPCQREGTHWQRMLACWSSRVGKKREVKNEY